MVLIICLPVHIVSVETNLHPKKSRRAPQTGPRFGCRIPWTADNSEMAKAIA